MIPYRLTIHGLLALVVQVTTVGGGLGCRGDSPLPPHGDLASDGDSTITTGVSGLPIGFDVADADRDGRVSRREWREYVEARLPEIELPHGLIFREIDTDGDRYLSEEEFDQRHAVLQPFLESLSSGDPPPPDPGTDFVPFAGPDRPLNDASILGAVFHRYIDLRADSAKWSALDFEQLPETIVAQLPSAAGQRRSLADVCRATVVLGGGSGEDDFFVGGAVIVSPSGLALTNYHLAESFNNRLIALTAAGDAVRVTRLLAGNPVTDIALIQLDTDGLAGEEFPWVPIAVRPVAMAEDIHVVHHSENRFFTYDRGYIKRYPMLGKETWMEISADYAPGGSGCGIFNADYQLVGLVSTIAMGDGPTLAMESLMDTREVVGGVDDLLDQSEGDDWVEGDMGTLVIKLAVPLMAIRSLLGATDPAGDGD